MLRLSLLLLLMATAASCCAPHSPTRPKQQHTPPLPPPLPPRKPSPTPPPTTKSSSTTAMPSTSSTAMPSTSSTAMPSTSSTAMPSTSSTAMPSTSSTAMPSTSSTAMSSTSSTAMPSTSSTAMPSTSSTAMPSTSSTAMPSTSSTAMPSTSSTAMSSTSSTAIPEECKPLAVIAEEDLRDNKLPYPVNECELPDLISNRFRCAEPKPDLFYKISLIVNNDYFHGNGTILDGGATECDNGTWKAVRGTDRFNVTKTCCLPKKPEACKRLALIANDDLLNTKFLVPDNECDSPNFNETSGTCSVSTQILAYKIENRTILDGGALKCDDEKWTAVHAAGRFNVTNACCLDEKPKVCDPLGDILQPDLDEEYDGHKVVCISRNVIGNVLACNATQNLVIQMDDRQRVRGAMVECVEGKWTSVDANDDPIEPTSACCIENPSVMLPDGEEAEEEQGCPGLDDIKQGELNRRFPEMGQVSMPNITKESAVCNGTARFFFFTDADGVVHAASSMACRNRKWIVLGIRGIPLGEPTKVACAPSKCTALGLMKKNELREDYVNDDNVCVMPTVNAHGVFCQGPIEILFYSLGNGEIVFSYNRIMECKGGKWNADYNMLNKTNVCCIDSLNEELQAALKENHKCGSLDPIELADREMFFADVKTEAPTVKGKFATCGGATPTLYYTDGNRSEIKSTARMECFGDVWHRVDRAGTTEEGNRQHRVICSE